MQRLLSSFITAVSRVMFESKVLRYVWYLLIILALLLFWLHFGEVEISFVYSDF